MNASWWSIDETETDDDTDAVFTAAAEGVAYEFVSDHVLGSVSKTSIGSMVLMAFVVAVLALLRWCALSTRKKAVNDHAGSAEMAVSGDYGTI